MITTLLTGERVATRSEPFCFYEPVPLREGDETVIGSHPYVAFLGPDDACKAPWAWRCRVVLRKGHGGRWWLVKVDTIPTFPQQPRKGNPCLFK